MYYRLANAFDCSNVVIIVRKYLSKLKYYRLANRHHYSKENIFQYTTDILLPSDWKVNNLSERTTA